MPSERSFAFIVGEDEVGLRLDAVLSSHVLEYTRSFLAGLIGRGLVQVEGKVRKPGYRLKIGESVRGCIPAPVPARFSPEPMDIDVVYEDEDLIAVNKPPGVVVHPAPGHATGTLVNGLLHRFPDIEGIGGEARPGIVHRLDMNTSGLLLVAKNPNAHHLLSRMFKQRTIEKTYLAVLLGHPERDRGTIDLPIGRHPIDRKRMSARNGSGGKPAMTRWHVLERWEGFSFVSFDLLTGRTHQIRVHCAAMGHPVLGDPVYASRKQLKERCRRLHLPDDLKNELMALDRQMLHAWKLQLAHPVTQRMMSLSVEMPADMSHIVDSLREYVTS